MKSPPWGDAAQIPVVVSAISGNLPREGETFFESHFDTQGQSLKRWAGSMVGMTPKKTTVCGSPGF